MASEEDLLGFMNDTENLFEDLDFQVLEQDLGNPSVSRGGDGMGLLNDSGGNSGAANTNNDQSHRNMLNLKSGSAIFNTKIEGKGESDVNNDGEQKASLSRKRKSCNVDNDGLGFVDNRNSSSKGPRFIDSKQDLTSASEQSSFLRQKSSSSQFQLDSDVLSVPNVSSKNSNDTIHLPYVASNNNQISLMNNNPAYYYYYYYNYAAAVNGINNNWPSYPSPQHSMMLQQQQQQQQQQPLIFPLRQQSSNYSQQQHFGVSSGSVSSSTMLNASDMTHLTFDRLLDVTAVPVPTITAAASVVISSNNDNQVNSHSSSKSKRNRHWPKLLGTISSNSVMNFRLAPSVPDVSTFQRYLLQSQQQAEEEIAIVASDHMPQPKLSSAMRLKIHFDEHSGKYFQISIDSMVIASFVLDGLAPLIRRHIISFSIPKFNQLSVYINNKNFFSPQHLQQTNNINDDSMHEISTSTTTTTTTTTSSSSRGGGGGEMGNHQPKNNDPMQQQQQKSAIRYLFDHLDGSILNDDETLEDNVGTTINYSDGQRGSVKGAERTHHVEKQRQKLPGEDADDGDLLDDLDDSDLDGYVNITEEQKENLERDAQLNALYEAVTHMVSEEDANYPVTNKNNNANSSNGISNTWKIPSTLQCELREYQKAALQWMLTRERPATVADDNDVGNDNEDDLSSSTSIKVQQEGNLNPGNGIKQKNALNNNNKGNCYLAQKLHPLYQERILFDPEKTKFYLNRDDGIASLEFVPAPPAARGGILADEMGLGKTVEIIAVCLGNPSPIRRKGSKGGGVSSSSLRPHHGNMNNGHSGKYETGCSLIVCPVALLKQWKSEIEKFSLSSSCYIYQGTKREKNPQKLLGFDFIITTYSTLANEYSQQISSVSMGSSTGRMANLPGEETQDLEDFQLDETAAGDGDVLTAAASANFPNTKGSGALFQMRFWRVVLDEAHNIKNRKSLQCRACCSIEAVNRWAVTGTPIQNHVDDLFSLFHFLRLTPHGDWRYWSKHITKPFEKKKKEAIAALQAVMSEVMIRRTKNKKVNGVGILQLPGKTIHVLELPMSNDERLMYDSLQNYSRGIFDSFLKQGTVLKNYANILEMLLHLRQFCDHPYLLLNSYQNQQHSSGTVSVIRQFLEAHANHSFTKRLLPPLAQLMAAANSSSFSSSSAEKSKNFDLESLFEKHWIPSTKLRVLVKHLLQIKDETKSIIFSQWTKMLDLVEIALEKEGIVGVRMDGSMNLRDRNNALEKFEKDPRVRVCMFSLKVGGVGLNLVCATHVFLLDPWWNPSVEEQAIGRCFGPGTMVLLADGRQKPVERVQIGDLLMGPDAKPRLVSDLISSREDELLYNIVLLGHEYDPVGTSSQQQQPTLTISNTSKSNCAINNSGNHISSNFYYSCTGDHILNLATNRNPYVIKHRDVNDRIKYTLFWNDITEEEEEALMSQKGSLMLPLVCEKHRTYATATAAEAERSRIANLPPIRWTLPVYLLYKMSDSVRKVSYQEFYPILYESDRLRSICREIEEEFLNFEAPSNTDILKMSKHINEVAWLLGLWIGDNERGQRSTRKADDDDDDDDDDDEYSHYYTLSNTTLLYSTNSNEIATRIKEYAERIGLTVMINSSSSSNGSSGTAEMSSGIKRISFKLIVKSRADTINGLVELIRRAFVETPLHISDGKKNKIVKRLPHFLTSDNLEVREWFLAGLMDSSAGHLTSPQSEGATAVTINTATVVVVVGGSVSTDSLLIRDPLIDLCRSLGLATTSCTLQTDSTSNHHNIVNNYNVSSSSLTAVAAAVGIGIKYNICFGGFTTASESPLLISVLSKCAKYSEFGRGCSYKYNNNRDKMQRLPVPCYFRVEEGKEAPFYGFKLKKLMMANVNNDISNDIEMKSNNIRLSLLKKQEMSDEQEQRCWSLESDDVFLLANGLAVHNCHRIGQEKDVVVYRFILANTIENKILHLQQTKLELAQGLGMSELSSGASTSSSDIAASSGGGGLNLGLSKKEQRKVRIEDLKQIFHDGDFEDGAAASTADGDDANEGEEEFDFLQFDGDTL